jgi:hypothetical protein
MGLDLFQQFHNITDVFNQVGFPYKPFLDAEPVELNNGCQKIAVYQFPLFLIQSFVI